MTRFFALAMVVVLSTCASLLESLRAGVGRKTGRTERFLEAAARGPEYHGRGRRSVPVEIVSRRIKVTFTGERDTLTTLRRAA